MFRYGPAGRDIHAGGSNIMQPNKCLPLVISGTAIRQDVDGRFSLNDLHKSAGGNPTHRPGEFLRLQQTQALISEIETAGIPAVRSKEGRGGGSFVAWQLVYAYAEWISPKFHLQVIEAYHQIATGAPVGLDQEVRSLKSKDSQTRTDEVLEDIKKVWPRKEWDRIAEERLKAEGP